MDQVEEFLVAWQHFEQMGWAYSCKLLLDYWGCYHHLSVSREMLLKHS